MLLLIGAGVVSSALVSLWDWQLSVRSFVSFAFFVLVLMDNEGLSQLSFLSPAHSFFPSLGCSGYHHNAAITKQYSGQIRLVRLFTAFVS